MIALLLLQLAEPAPTKPPSSAEIVVIGKRLADAYAECLDHRCTPAQDAKVTIALAEQRLRDGNYVAAKDMLAKAVARNRKFEKTFPKSLAALYDAYGTVAFQEGDTEVFRRAVSDQVGVLRRNLAPTDPDVVYATIIVGDMWMTLKNYSAASMEYRAAEQQSTRQGQAVASLVASLRRVSVMTALGLSEQATQLLARIESSPAATDPAVHKGVQIARARLSTRHAKEGDVDRAVASVTQDPGSEPLLLHVAATPPSLRDQSVANARRFLQPSAGDDLPSGIAWADVGFRVTPDGRTDQVAVLRGTASKVQMQGIVAQITNRRYAAQPGGNGQQRLERYTFRGEYRVPINSRIRRRWGPADMTVLDLSPFPTPNPPPAPSAPAG